MTTTRNRKAQKTVQIIARYAIKNSSTVCYLVRSSNGNDQYCVTLSNGHATGCTCPSVKPCYHMIQIALIESARQAIVKTDASLDRELANAATPLIFEATSTAPALDRKHAEPRVNGVMRGTRSLAVACEDGDDLGAIGTLNKRSNGWLAILPSRQKSA